jgi:predicted nuclease of predicted toxin-antitoxin system
MKVLLDTCVWGGSLRHLEAAGLDVVWTGGWPEDPGDEEILAFAHKEQRVLVTLDKDLGELAILRKQPHCGILRLVNIAARNQGPVCLRVLNLYHKDLQAGAIVTVRDDRVRIRPPDTDESA